MADVFKFAAFVSYSSKDRRFAKRLHTSLERYSIPKKLGRFHLVPGGKPNRVYPVCLDREEFPSGALDETIEAALRDSANLIVVCSPHAAASKWVGNEIAYFRSLGRGDRIFLIIADTAPVLVDGKDATALAFHDVLTAGGDLPLAADARRGKDGFRNAWLKVIAGLVGVNAGALRDRDRARRRAQARLIGSVSTAAVALTAGALWAFVLPQTSYAKSYVRVFGEWQPVDPVSPETQHSREATLRFTRNGALGRVVQVENINGVGKCPLGSSSQFTSFTGDAFDIQCNATKACAVEILYQGDEVIGENLLDQRDKVLESIRYESSGVNAIRTEAVTGCSRTDNGIKFIEVERAASGPNKGQDIEHRYFAERNQPHANRQFAYGYKFGYDAAGRQIEMTALDEQGQPSATSAGWTVTRTRWSDTGDPILVSFLDADLKAVDASGGFASKTLKYDGAGNAIESRVFDAAGTPAFREDGFHAMRITFGESGLIASQTYLDASMKPIAIDIGVASIAFTRDANGWVNGRRFFDESGKPTVDNDGCGQRRNVISAVGDDLEWRCFDTLGAPQNGKNGWHARIRKVDAIGNAIEEAMYGTQMEPVAATYGIHRTTFSYNEQHLRETSRYFDTAGKPMLDNRGFAGFDYSYDGRGHVTKEARVDAAGLPTASSNGTHATIFANDPYGRMLRQTLIGLDQKILESADNNFTFKYDQFGREVERTTVDAMDQPVNGSAGFATRRTQYDKLNRIQRYSYFDVLGQPAGGPNGAPIETYLYDRVGRRIETQYLDAQQKPIIASSGAAITRSTYDARGHFVETTYFDADGKPINGQENWARVAYKRNEQGLALETRFYLASGEPARLSTGIHGWSRSYDAFGRQIEHINRNSDWTPMARPDESPIAIYRYAYDDRGRRIGESYFDISGSPASTATVPFAWRYEYDERGNRSRGTFLDGAGNPYLDDGIAIIAFDRDMAGREVGRRYYGIDGVPVAAGIEARMVLSRDALGRETSRRYYDASGALVARSTGHAISRLEYDRMGNQTLEAYFDVNEQPVDHNAFGWQRKSTTRSETGAVIEETCFRKDDTPAPCRRPG